MGIPLWAALRMPASYNGLPFVVIENSYRRGRQVALHTYPFRDDPWPEDLGRSPRITSMRCFVVGEDCDSQLEALALAVQMPGPGQLVHPTIGAFSATVLEFTASNTVEGGRMHSFEMSVVPYVPRIYPVATADTQAQTQGLFGSMGTAIATDFSAVTTTIGSAAQAVSGVVRTAQGFISQATGLVSSATALAGLPAALSGNFGRYAGGNLASGVLSLGGGVTTIAQAAGIASTAAANVNTIGVSINRLASQL
jgi:prophage DNA circulation protein